MSDIRAQSRRDAEFDRLLNRMFTPDCSWVPPLIREAYEMGKRHGREEAKPQGCQACRETGLAHCAHPEDCGNFDEVTR